jgi:glyoxylase-like metal-dependent hydrolase (beta-lactamase superfamily II)/8-oxo-dGTP pyrophosphatase MutT (NUDIX family)
MTSDRLPIRCAATVVLVREGRSALEFLMVTRRSSATHFSGACVFPGGVVDEADQDPRVLQRVTGLAESEANRRLRLDSGALAYWPAAVRECYEETGILLAREESGQPLSRERLEQLRPRREALVSGRLGFAELLQSERLLIPADEIVYFAHWITPPIQPQRFDTRFFIALAPEGQEPATNDAELEQGVWLSARQVLEAAGRKELKLAFPTRHTLESLGQFASSAAVLAHARGLEEIEVNRPCLAQGRDGAKLFRLGDPPYAEIHWADPQQTGTWTYDWQPGAVRTLDRYVSRILAPNAGPLTGPGTNTYLVGTTDCAVIDPGPDDPAHIEAILAAGAGRIRWIVLTHTHEDHSAGVQALQRATGARVAGRTAPSTHENVAVSLDRVLADGDTIELGETTLTAIQTPGHASNHVCLLFQPTRMLFTGDHVMQGSTVVISPPDGNMRAYLRSLERLAGLDIAILAPGHGYLIGNPGAELMRLVRHRLAREQKVRKALNEAGGTATLETLLPRVYDDVPAQVHGLARRSLFAHLEKMVEDGELACTEDRYSILRAPSRAG